MVFCIAKLAAASVCVPCLSPHPSPHSPPPPAPWSTRVRHACGRAWGGTGAGKPFFWKGTGDKKRLTKGRWCVHALSFTPLQKGFFVSSLHHPRGRKGNAHTHSKNAGPTRRGGEGSGSRQTPLAPVADHLPSVLFHTLPTFKKKTPRHTLGARAPPLLLLQYADGDTALGRSASDGMDTPLVAKQFAGGLAR